MDIDSLRSADISCKNKGTCINYHFFIFVGSLSSTLYKQSKDKNIQPLSMIYYQIPVVQYVVPYWVQLLFQGTNSYGTVSFNYEQCQTAIDVIQNQNIKAENASQRAIILLAGLLLVLLVVENYILFFLFFASFGLWGHSHVLSIILKLQIRTISLT